MSKIIDSTIIIDNQEYVLFYTQSDFEYPDLEVALKVCLKSDLEKIKKEYSNIDEYIYLVKPFCINYNDLKERIKEYYEED